MKLKIRNEIIDTAVEPVMFIFEGVNDRIKFVQEVAQVPFHIKKYVRFPNTPEWKDRKKMKGFIDEIPAESDRQGQDPDNQQGADESTNGIVKKDPADI